jgi:4-diphosphocytidyl-2-C-methyl-D-erythritol kinase
LKGLDPPASPPGPQKRQAGKKKTPASPGLGSRFARTPEGEGLRGLCPAKVNLYLRVRRRRPDGYHDLVTVMQPLTLADELTVSPQGPGLRLACDHPGLPQGEENLVWRAALRFGQETGREVAAQITLGKRIPVAAGLGGGSSDAAATLLALNLLAGEPLDAVALKSLAGRLGADVPFFLCLGPAVARGIGTELSPLKLPPYWYVLLNPGMRLSTRWVYENLDLARLRGLSLLEEEGLNPEKPENWVHNDLEMVTLTKFPELKDLIRDLGRLGARASGMSGSGPTIFGLFSTLKAAREAARQLRRTFQGWMVLARGLTGSETDLAWENQAWMA